MPQTQKRTARHGLRQEFAHWTTGIRLYIGIAIALTTLQIWWWAATSYDSRELITSRLHEAYGWVALGLLAGALFVGPIYKVAPRLGGAPIARDARRMLGIGAAWFAALHASIAYIGSFQAINPLQLTTTYQRGFALGAVAAMVLLAMAFTSFDAAFRTMGIWWFRVHRLVYAGSALAVWHALSIGVHAPSLPALATFVAVGATLFVLHMQAAMQQEKAVSTWQIITLCIMGIVIIALANYGIQLYITQNSLQGHGH